MSWIIHKVFLFCIYSLQMSVHHSPYFLNDTTERSGKEERCFFSYVSQFRTFFSNEKFDIDASNPCIVLCETWIGLTRIVHFF
jgi:hypothetical protein